ncbi:MAG: D-aminoacyl-tRNA deacylase [Candidatus Rhabdochlamydia sp.]
MKIVIQRVTAASVQIDETVISSIGKGSVVLVGFHQDDQPEVVRWMANKLAHLRYFPDALGKTNLCLNDIDAELLIVSQFTLYASCEQGRRPTLIQAANPQIAKPLYDLFLEELRRYVQKIQTGVFGKEMALSLVNDGPFTLIIER